MKGRIVKDWGAVDIANPEHRRKVFGALQHFFDVRGKDKSVRAAMQHFATTGDFPTSVLEVIEKFGLETNYDEGWREVFDVKDFTSSNRNGFQLLDVEHGLTFQKVAVGQKAKIYKMAGDKVTVNFDLYGAGLGWHRTLFDDREYWTLEDNARAFANKAAADMAQVYYDLIDAVGSGQNLAWQAPTPATLPNTDANYAAVRDMNTIAKAIETILLAVKDKGYGATVRSPFVALAPIQLMPRVARALGLLNAGLAGSLPGVSYNVRPVYSMMLASSSVYYVILPKVKMKAGIRMNLTIKDQFDAESYSDIAVGWMRHGGAIGDTDQIIRCATA